jgi:hypothetical protein
MKLAGPTSTEKIDELTKLVSSIYPRIEFFQRDLDRLSAVKSETRIAVLEEKIAKGAEVGRTNEYRED